MAWCCKTTSHHLSQCLPCSLSPYGIIRPQWLNYLTPGKSGCKFRFVILKHFIDWYLWNCPQINAKGLYDDKSALVQVMACCNQATSHYLSQCWPRFMMPYGVTRPQWANTVTMIIHVCKHAADWLQADNTVQCGAIITRSIFSQMFTKDTQ